LLVFDIDNFKRINDTWGHPTGDVMLRAVAEICRNSFRQGIDLVARVGGEEFAVLMPATGHVEALQVAERLRLAIAEHQVVLGDHERISCTVSIGVVTVAAEELETTDFDSMLINADRALYRAKSSGRNQVVGFHCET
jgi:diguanylate cyclase (GGDEF)-like protein